MPCMFYLFYATYTWLTISWSYNWPLITMPYLLYHGRAIYFLIAYHITRFFLAWCMLYTWTWFPCYSDTNSCMISYLSLVSSSLINYTVDMKKMNGGMKYILCKLLVLLGCIHWSMYCTIVLKYLVTCAIHLETIVTCGHDFIYTRNIQGASRHAIRFGWRPYLWP